MKIYIPKNHLKIKKAKRIIWPGWPLIAKLRHDWWYMFITLGNLIKLNGIDPVVELENMLEVYKKNFNVHLKGKKLNRWEFFCSLGASIEIHGIDPVHELKHMLEVYKEDGTHWGLRYYNQKEWERVKANEKKRKKVTKKKKQA